MEKRKGGTLEQVQVLIKAPKRLVNTVKDRLPEHGYARTGELTKNFGEGDSRNRALK